VTLLLHGRFLEVLRRRVASRPAFDRRSSRCQSDADAWHCFRCWWRLYRPPSRPLEMANVGADHLFEPGGWAWPWSCWINVILTIGTRHVLQIVTPKLCHFLSMDSIPTDSRKHSGTGSDEVSAWTNSTPTNKKWQRALLEYVE
jgi:hypothetical protein